MRLVRAHVENFKLLKDVHLAFSTDPQRPLTVIRAENGSGKTSLLYALLWAFYGIKGLPENAQTLRLASSAIPSGHTTDISVRLEFEHTDDTGQAVRYRLIRTVSETAGDGDIVKRDNERVRLLRITTAGDEELSGGEALVGKLVPLRLKNVFFTNGDDVQTFISGQVSTQQRQGQVHASIRALLGLEALRTAVADADHVHKRLRTEAAKSGGADAEALEEKLRGTDDKLSDLRERRDALTERLRNMVQSKADWEKELTRLRGMGDLEELNRRIEQGEEEQRRLEGLRGSALGRMRDAVRSESCSWALMGTRLEKGLSRLDELADRNVIPGTSVQVLTDRLEMGVCICGEALGDGSPHRSHVESLRDDQMRVTEERHRLTELFHHARQALQTEEARVREGQDFANVRSQLLHEFTEARDLLAAKAAEVQQDKERRELIPEDRVRELTEKIRHVEAQLGNTHIQLGELNSQVEQLEERREEEERRLQEALRRSKVNDSLVAKRNVAQDLLTLAAGTLEVLEIDHVRRVSDCMSARFMEIVGSDPDFQAGVFTGVRIDEAFNIVVETHAGRSLDTDFELNGASQRALTLSFIWALMEVSGTAAPRVIDTPLGMVSGGVKTRMVDAITRPAETVDADFQVILLLTRSELRDVESLLDERAGVSCTLSSSQHYPEDLRFDWDVSEPMSRVCACTHRQSCRVCARHYDDSHGIEFRDFEAVIA